MSRPLELISAMETYRNKEKGHNYNLELKALDELKNDLTKKLKSFQTDLANDKKELENQETIKNFNLKNIYTILVEEKTLITDYVNLISNIVEVLKSDSKEIKIQIKKLLEKGDSSQYLNSLLKTK